MISNKSSSTKKKSQSHEVFYSKDSKCPINYCKIVYTSALSFKYFLCTLKLSFMFSILT